MRKFIVSKLPVIALIISIITLGFVLFCSYVYPMNSAEVIEYEGKIVEIGLLLPIEVNPDRYILTLFDVEVLRVFIHLDFIIPTDYVAIKYNSKPFILPCKYIVYIREQ